jgi:hypothetical protein
MVAQLSNSSFLNSINKMKKLITIPDKLVEPLRIMSAVENKGNLHAQIIDILSKAVEAHKAKSFPK